MNIIDIMNNTTNYETLPDLVAKIGDSFVMNRLASYTINIDTSKALDIDNVFDFDLDVEKDTLIPIINSLKRDSQFNKLDDINDMLCVLEFIDKLLNYCVFDFRKVDYFVISNAGKYNVRLAIKPEKKMKTGNTLYIDIQSVRIAIIDELVTNKFNYYYNIFNYGIKGVIGGYILSYIYSMVNV
jgi:hypothetical protein